MSEAAVVLDDMTRTDLRHLADRLLETTRVEYVDDGVLLVTNPPPPGTAPSCGCCHDRSTELM